MSNFIQGNQPPGAGASRSLSATTPQTLTHFRITNSQQQNWVDPHFPYKDLPIHQTQRFNVGNRSLGQNIQNPSSLRWFFRPPRQAFPIQYNSIAEVHGYSGSTPKLRVPFANGNCSSQHFSSVGSRNNYKTNETRHEERKWEYTTWGRVVRPKYGTGTIANNLTLMSYNVLAPTLLENHRNLYNNCKYENLTVQHRLSKFLSEVNDFKPDILCLQEIEAEYFNKFYENELQQKGYTGVFLKRTQEKVDGCAIFYKTAAYSLIDKLEVEYHQPHVDILNRDNVGLLLKLKSKNGPNLKFVVGTTHLLYNPKRQDVRVAQIQFLLAELDRFAFCGFENYEPSYHPIILSGDLNMEPFSHGVKLLTEGKMNYETILGYNESRANKKIKWGYLPPHFGVSDQCQHYKIVRERLNRMESMRQKIHFELDLKEQNRFVNIRSVESVMNTCEVDIKNADIDEVNPIDIDAKTVVLIDLTDDDPPSIEPKTNVTLSQGKISQEVKQNPIDPTDVKNFDFKTVVLVDLTDTDDTSLLEPNIPEVKKTSQKIQQIQNESDCQFDINVLNQLNDTGTPCSFGSCEITHRFNFKSVYAAQLDRKDHCENIATTKQIGWVCVDYILYSTVWSHRHQRRVEGNLKLIRRYGLPTKQQCAKMGSMPNDYVSSDHFPLIAEFSLK